MVSLKKIYGYDHLEIPDYGNSVGRDHMVDIPERIPTERMISTPDLTIAGSSSITGSIMGTPVFADIELYIEGVGRLYNQSILITISQQKNIVRTSVNDRAGTVKEYVSDGDFSITLQGVMVGEGNSYPIDEITILRKLLLEPQNIKVISPYLEQWGIFEITVESYNIPQQQGWQNIQPFEISAYSDVPLELIHV